jgi:hypothetical protein
MYSMSHQCDAYAGNPSGGRQAACSNGPHHANSPSCPSLLVSPCSEMLQLLHALIISHSHPTNCTATAALWQGLPHTTDRYTCSSMRQRAAVAVWRSRPCSNLQPLRPEQGAPRRCWRPTWTAGRRWRGSRCSPHRHHQQREGAPRQLQRWPASGAAAPPLWLPAPSHLRTTRHVSLSLGTRDCRCCHPCAAGSSGAPGRRSGGVRCCLGHRQQSAQLNVPQPSCRWSAAGTHAHRGRPYTAHTLPIPAREHSRATMLSWSTPRMWARQGDTVHTRGASCTPCGAPTQRGCVRTCSGEAGGLQGAHDPLLVLLQCLGPLVVSIGHLLDVARLRLAARPGARLGARTRRLQRRVQARCEATRPPPPARPTVKQHSAE